MKNFWNAIKMIVYSYAIQTIMVIIGIILFALIIGYQNVLSDMDKIYEVSIWGTAIASIPIVIYLYKKYKIKESKIKVNRLLLMIPLGMCISLFYNMLVFNYLEETEVIINKILLISYVVIIGPIFEEIVFRYVGLRFAMKEYSLKKAIIIISIVFALLHSGVLNIIYAFLIGIVLSYIYVKYKNIMYPIVLHVSANLMSIFIMEFNLIALVIGFVGIVLIYFYLRKENHV